MELPPAARAPGVSTRRRSRGRAGRPLPDRLEPELATLASAAPPGDDWLHEIKFDGYRVICRLEHGERRLLTRRGVDWTDHFPTLLGPLAQVPAETALLDGEVVYVQDDGRTSFPALASALQGGTDPQGRIVYYVFDLVHLNGFDLTRAPLWARKEALERLLAGLPSGARVRFVDHVRGRGEEFVRQACGFALEGAVAKRADSAYRPGRGRDWLKVKCLHRQELLVVGFTERTGDDGGVGAILVGYHDGPDGPVRCAGRVGTGWDDRTMRDLRGRLDALLVSAPPCLDPPRGRAAAGVRWVEPALVAEIEFLDWNGHDALRHASFEGLRSDKRAGDVVLEQAAPARGRRGDGPATVAGVAISHPGRVMYADIGLTKLEVARYYEEVAEGLMPHIARRPLTLVRCPDGATAQCFFQKHAVDQFPDTIIEVPIRESGRSATYVAVDSLAGVLALVQMGALEFHVWGSRVETLERPDQMVFDLDPADGLPFARTIAAATTLRGLLAQLGLASFVKTSGGKGLHVVVPLRPVRPWADVKEFSHAVAELMVRAEPERYVATMSRPSEPARSTSTTCATAAAPPSSRPTRRAGGRALR